VLNGCLATGCRDAVPVRYGGHALDEGGRARLGGGWSWCFLRVNWRFLAKDAQVTPEAHHVHVFENGVDSECRILYAWRFRLRQPPHPPFGLRHGHLTHSQQARPSSARSRTTRPLSPRFSGPLEATSTKLFRCLLIKTVSCLAGDSFILDPERNVTSRGA
jgi:hypothetical protein